MENKKVVLRADRAGVFFGTLKELNGKIATITNVRKIYYWEGACAVEQLAVDGTTKPNDCKLTVSVDEMVITDVIQVLTCTEKSIESLSKIKEWKR